MNFVNCLFCNQKLKAKFFAASCNNHIVKPSFGFNTNNSICRIIYQFDNHCISVEIDKYISIFSTPNTNMPLFNYKLICNLPYQNIHPELAELYLNKVLKLKSFL